MQFSDHDLKQLDEASRPQGVVEVLQLRGSISGESLQNALRPITGVSSGSAPKAIGKPVENSPKVEAE